MLQLIKLADSVAKMLRIDAAETEDKKLASQLETMADQLLKEVDAEKDKRKNYAYQVMNMRKEQIAYFTAAKQKNRDFALMNNILKRSKALEADVDRRTVEIIEGVTVQKMF